jgi:hypothetical protein
MKEIRDDCLLIEHQLALWVGNDLDAELAARVARHVAQCERCADEVRALDAARGVLIGRLHAEEHRAPDLWPDVASALRREGRFSGAPSPVTAAVIERTTALDPVPRAAVPSHPRRRNARSWTKFGVSAAAAVLMGFMLGRFAAHSPESPRQDLASHSISGEGVRGGVAAVSSAAVVPVAEGKSLRRLVPGETSLSDGAHDFVIEERFSPRSTANGNVGSPASLHTVPGD